jgi:hypothetical protein
VEAYAGRAPAIAVSDRFAKDHETWIIDSGIAPPWNDPTICSIRFDIDFKAGWNRSNVLQVCRIVQSLGLSLGLITNSFSTGNRGIQSVFKLPSKVTTRIATGLAALIRESLSSAIGELATVDVDSTGSILRLPGCNHAKTKFLALYIDIDNDCFYDEEQQARLIGSGFSVAPKDNKDLMTPPKFNRLISELEGVFDEKGISHHSQIRQRPLAQLIVDSLPTSRFVIVSEAKSAVLNTVILAGSNCTKSPTSGLSGDNGKAEYRFQNPPAAGETWTWMTQSYGGVWAAKVLFGDDGLDELLKLLSQVPSSSASKSHERERTARKLWESFKLFPPKVSKKIHPEDIEIVVKIADAACKIKRIYHHRLGDKTLPLSKNCITNITFVSYAMLYCLRKKGGVEFKLSIRNGARIVNSMFSQTMSANTFDNTVRLIESEQRYKNVITGRNREIRTSIPVGKPPLVPVFERVKTTTTYYKPSDWLKTQFVDIRNR